MVRFGRIRRYRQDLLLVSETVGAHRRIAILTDEMTIPKAASQFTLTDHSIALRRESESDSGSLTQLTWTEWACAQRSLEGAFTCDGFQCAAG